MIQHRHNFPGYVGPESSNTKWWHPADMVHTKKMYAHAHDEILETREKGEKSVRTTTRQDTRKDPEATRALYELERIN